MSKERPRNAAAPRGEGHVDSSRDEAEKRRSSTARVAGSALLVGGAAALVEGAADGSVAPDAGVLVRSDGDGGKVAFIAPDVSTPAEAHANAPRHRHVHTRSTIEHRTADGSRDPSEALALRETEVEEHAPTDGAALPHEILASEPEPTVDVPEIVPLASADAPAAPGTISSRSSDTEPLDDVTLDHPTSPEDDDESDPLRDHESGGLGLPAAESTDLGFIEVSTPDDPEGRLDASAEDIPIGPAAAMGLIEDVSHEGADPDLDSQVGEAALPQPESSSSLVPEIPLDSFEPSKLDPTSLDDAEESQVDVDVAAEAGDDTSFG